MKPILRTLNRQLRVEKVIQEIPGTASIYIKGKNLESFNYKAGQFAYFRFLSEDFPLEMHTFSFSTAKNNKFLRITVKAVGDYTALIQNFLRPNSLVFIDGPYGNFCLSEAITKNIIMIGQGNGVAPIRALIEEAEKTTGLEKPKAILYFEKITDMIFTKELNDFKKVEKFYMIKEREDDFKNFIRRGEINIETIKKFVPDYQHYDFFISCPRVKNDELFKELRALGVPKKQIHIENYQF